MTTKSSANEFDVIVIGSGMGGMTTAAALSRLDHKVLLLEQAQAIGGLTHSFSHEGFSWDVGLHYCGTFGHDQLAGRILDWLSGGTIEFRSVGTVYDTLHFPDGFEISVGRPAEAYKMELKERFPDNAAEIDAYFEALLSAEEAAHMVGAERAIPEPFRSAHHWWNKKKIQRWCSRTTDEVIAELTSNPKLASVLSAQWGTYGGKPKEASFAFHATIIGHYLEGAAYPVGGATAIASRLVPVIEAAGGSARAGTPVSEILLEDGKAVGVRTSSGEEFNAPTIVSAIGAGETVKHLLPEEICQQPWAREIATFKPSICHFDLFLGFEGDIAQHGATRSNHWFYQSWDTNDAIWAAAGDESIPMMFVSFASLKDPTHDPGPNK
ncbi:NAD(P)/FAD-dependent oxidoreductase [Aestuariicella hydrocarbonica]|uniref:NAD(P)/FAD-dependent oxidoreductase n=1 Tax=Pseudomaricurvus hydrocarbonicus TaxID=1470433 RepID=A0A9E5MN56_9GAMM|nr:NAD(P)/FAD-dependent oxidoreductase [Aestuariicella hydrocarbonica]NHO67311.1 NAD(P)/FAD-dependent oxidoreductase [Aestuariicella hydrocarbonica]